MASVNALLRWGCFLAALAVTSAAVQGAPHHHSYNSYGHSILQTPHIRNYTTCPRDESRWARDIVKEYVFSHLGRSGVQALPDSCPLRPDLDTFHVEDKKRIFHRHSLWQCGFCKKKFRTGEFLDKHMSRHHANETPATADVCLADLCDSLHCPWFHARKYRKQEGGTATLSAHCLPTAAARAASECEGLADACFDPTRGRTWAAMHKYFTKHFCGSLTCDHSGRERLLLAALHATERRWALWVLGVVLVALIIVFYVGLYVYHKCSSATQRRAPVGIGGSGAAGARSGLKALGRGRIGGAPSWLPPGLKPKNY